MTENKTQDINKASFDPGWNDPPKFVYSDLQNQLPRTRNHLNKRVAFPLSGTSINSVGQVSSLPPSTTCLSPPPIPLVKTIQPSHIEELVDSEGILKEIKDILLEFLKSSSELGSKTNDIKRRIDIMEEMWIGGKLCSNVKLQMRDLAYALKDDQPVKADNIHRALMVDYVSSVGVWMPGIKQLVHHCIARSELLAIDKS